MSRDAQRVGPLPAILAGVTLWALCGPALSAVPLALVPVGDPGNPPDANGRGAVGYGYQIGRHEVTNAQYAAFLNAVAATDAHGLYNPRMSITRHGASGGHTYSTAEGNLPVRFVSWFDAVRFANWLHNGRPGGRQDARTTEGGAYTFHAPNEPGGRNPGARYFLPSEDEWYKAAYYRGAAQSGLYWSYPTQSNTTPQGSPPAQGANRANYNNVTGGVTPVGAYPGTATHYGTFDQAGNVWEWTETAIDTDRGLRGGSWNDYALLLTAAYRDSEPPTAETEFAGFRVAAAATVVPPPNAGPLARDDAYTVEQDTLLAVETPGVLANDTDGDGDALYAEKLTDPAHGTVELDPDGALTYIPDRGFVGTDSFRYRAVDTAGESNAATVTITVERRELDGPLVALAPAAGDAVSAYRPPTFRFAVQDRSLDRFAIQVSTSEDFRKYWSLSKITATTYTLNAKAWRSLKKLLKGRADPADWRLYWRVRGASLRSKARIETSNVNPFTVDGGAIVLSAPPGGATADLSQPSPAFAWRDSIAPWTAVLPEQHLPAQGLQPALERHLGADVHDRSAHVVRPGPQAQGGPPERAGHRLLARPGTGPGPLSPDAQRRDTNAAPVQAPGRRRGQRRRGR
jgi:hypothetical protein